MNPDTQKIQNIINELSNMMIDLDVKNRGETHRLTELDIVNAALIFNSVIANYAIHKRIEDGISTEKVRHKTYNMGNRISKLILEHTDFNTKTFYSELTK